MSQLKYATLAGGCFWCMVKPFDTWDGILEVVSGYTGGTFSHPTYEQVKTGSTGHYEAVRIHYDEEKMSYQTILDLYFTQIDPTDDGGQFHDRGSQYKTAIFFYDETQKKQAEAAIEKLARSGTFMAPIITKVLPAKPFYEAEAAHQAFYKKNKAAYESDREKSGRDAFIKKYYHR